MVQTNTQISACDVVIKAQTTEGDMLDISGSSNSVNIRFLQPTGQLRTFGSRFFIRQQCGKDAEVAISAVYTTSDREAMEWLKDWYFNHPSTSRKVEVYAPDDEAGSDKFTFTLFLEDLSVPLESGNADPVLCPANFKPTGEFTWEKVAS